MTYLDSVRADWNAACERAEAAYDAWRAAGAPKSGGAFDAYKAACRESHRISDIWYAAWKAAGYPVSAPEALTEGGG